ncbi:MAG: flagellar hook-length control protein FliK [Solirubrobacteraceae bacterium]|nr:flagellar hook-length control protein FliK [Solirubrobacteraceae bacterium]
MSLPAIQAALLRNLMQQVSVDTPDQLPQQFRVGETLGGRIALSATGEKMLMIAGVRIPAQLPADVVPGQGLRLQVTEVTVDRLVLQIVRDAAAAPELPVAGPRELQQPQATSGVQSPVVTVPMPTGASARVWADPDGSSGGDGHDAARAEKARTGSMVVRYDSPVLGRVDVVLRLDADRLEATVLAPAGEPLSRVRESSSRLREALLVAAQVPVALQTAGRTEDAVNVRV